MRKPFFLAAVFSVLPVGANAGTINACHDAAEHAAVAVETAGAARPLERLSAHLSESVPRRPNHEDPPAAPFLAEPLALLADRAVASPYPSGIEAASSRPHPASIETLWADYLDLDAQLGAALASVSDAQSDRLHALLPRLLPRTSNGEDLETIEDGVIIVEIDDALDHDGLQQLARTLPTSSATSSTPSNARDTP
jgi:hypothetical protein